MVFGSLKTTNDFYTNIWGPPIKFIWENYVEAWRRAEQPSIQAASSSPFGREIKNPRIIKVEKATEVPA